jgi:DNA-binding PadR family transcriptional regulator
MPNSLTPRQRNLLYLLSSRPKSARDIEYDGFGFTEASARGCIYRLARRGLVDVAGFDSSTSPPRRTYGLTNKGSDLLLAVDWQESNLRIDGTKLLRPSSLGGSS